MDRRKTIAFVGNYNLINMNAAGKRIKGLADAVSEQYDILFIGCGGKNFSGTVDEINKGYRGAFFPTPSKFTDRILIGKYFRFTKSILEAEKNITCVVSYGSPVLAYYVKKLQKWCKKRNIVFISDVVDMIFYNGTNGVIDKVKEYDTRYLKMRIVPKSDGVIAISNRIKNYYQSVQGVNNVIVIPSITKKLEKKANIHLDDKIGLIYAGIPFNHIANISENKMKDRLDWAIELINGLLENGIKVTFDIFGISKEDYLYSIPRHRELLEKCENNIVFHGKTSQNEVEKAMELADYSLLLREKNDVTESGFPTKLSESLSVGTPVIVTDTSDILSYIVEYKNGVVLEDYGVSENNIKKVVSVLDNISLVSDMKKYCEANYPFEPRLFSNKLYKFIREVKNV